MTAHCRFPIGWHVQKDVVDGEVISPDIPGGKGFSGPTIIGDKPIREESAAHLLESRISRGSKPAGAIEQDERLDDYTRELVDRCPQGGRLLAPQHKNMVARSRVRRVVFALVAVVSLILVVSIPSNVAASNPVLLSQTIVEASHTAGTGASGTVYGYATVWQDPSTRNIQVSFGREPGKAYTAQGNGASGASCALSTGSSPVGLVIIKVYGSTAGQLDFASAPALRYLSGSPNWMDQSDSGTHGSEYIQACFASSSSTSIDISASWVSIAYDSGIYLTVAIGDPSTSDIVLKSFNLISSNGAVQGTVTDTVGVVIPGVPVTFSNAARQYTTTSSSSGTYSLTGLLPDTYYASVVSPCAYKPSSPTTITIPGGSITTQNFALEHYLFASLTGYVYGGSTSNPISGATVTDTCGNYQTRSSSTGLYTLSTVSDKTITVTVVGPCQYQAASGQFNIPDGTTQTHNWVLPAWPLGTLSGYVYDATGGGGIPGATVKDSCSGATTTTDANGFYSLAVVSGKQIAVTASALGYKAQSILVTVPSGGSATQNFLLNPKGPPHPP